MHVTGLRSAIAGASLLLCAGAALALDLGEKAPELEVTGWVQGDPVKVAEATGRNVFVVAFMATFKPECEKLVLDAAKLEDRYKARGLEIVVVSTETADEVKKFLAGRKVNFRVAVDENQNTTAAYGVTDVPFAVVVDRTGSICFAGDPADGMEKVVDDVMAGKFDLKRTVEVAKLHGEVHTAERAGDMDKVDELCDRILALDATDTSAFRRRADGYERKEDLDGYRKFVKALADRVKDDAKALSWVAWRLLTNNRWNWRDPELALGLARRGVDVSKSADADVIDTYAHVLGELGLFEQAIAQEKKAVALDANDEDYKKAVAFFESCLAVREKVQPAPPPKKK